ncbi:MAG: ATP-binding protein [Methylocystaceae bacterium]
MQNRIGYHNANITIYPNSWEHLSDELQLLDLRIKLRLEQQRLRQSHDGNNQFKGLVISEQEVAALLSEQIMDEVREPGMQNLLQAIERMQEYLHARTQLSLNHGVHLPLEYLTWAFDLSPFEKECVVLALANEIERKYEKLFGFLQDDINCKYPTIDLALQLLCQDEEERQSAYRSLTMNSPLFKYLIEVDDSARGLRLAHPLKLNRRIVELFRQRIAVDPELTFFIDFYNPYDELEPLRLDQDIQEHLRLWLQMQIEDENNTRKPLVILSGPTGSGKRFQIRHLCQFFDTSLFVIDLARLPADELQFEKILHDVVREALLFSALPCFQGLENILPDNGTLENINPEEKRTRWNLLLQALEDLPGPIFMKTEKSWQLAEMERLYTILAVELKVPSELIRKELWEAFSQSYAFKQLPNWGEIASKFRFTPGQVKNALLKAREASYGRGNLMAIEDLYQACFSQGRHYLGRIATKVNPRYTWDDIILPRDTVEMLKNACNQMKNRYIVYGQWGFEHRLAYGRGLSMLFSGLPGTGKTMAAQVIAHELNLELYRIDLAQVVSKYIGETEKNLSRIFKEAESSNSILFFDEADALFGKRSEVKDAHDRYSNIEIAYLLQKIEEYDGISILATNLAKNLDDAFVRRITFIVEFPFPDADYRQRIWHSMIPPQTPVHENVDFGFLARRFEIAGGNIKNIVLAAAFLAAQNDEEVTMQHFLRAVKYEYQKIGRVLLREDLGEYYGEV